MLVDALSRVPCQPEGICTKPTWSEPTTKVDAQWSILNEPALAECLEQFPLRPTGLAAGHGNGSLRPAGKSSVNT